MVRVFFVVETYLFGFEVAFEVLFFNESDQSLGTLKLKVRLPQPQIRNFERMLVEKGRVGYRFRDFLLQLKQTHLLVEVDLARLLKLINILLRKLGERRNQHHSEKVTSKYFENRPEIRSSIRIFAPLKFEIATELVLNQFPSLLRHESIQRLVIL